MGSALGGLRHGNFTATNVTLRQILGVAYGLAAQRIFGPDLLSQERFDFQAKSPEGVADTEVKPLLEGLLKDRFHLVAHSELREMPVFNLVVAKGGVKMPVFPAPDGPPQRPEARGFPMMRGTVTTSRLAEMLTGEAGRPVLDKTGLNERYNLFLSYAPLSSQAAGKAPELAPPDLFTAVQEQLGLKLEPDKAKIEVVVVDHIERMPSDN